MRNPALRFVMFIALAITALVLVIPKATSQERLQAQPQNISVGNGDCVPFGGTIYGWHTPDAWLGTGTFALGPTTKHVNLRSVTTTLNDNGPTWTGSESVAIDFGGGNTLRMPGEFVAEGMTDQALAVWGVSHISEIGTFAKSTGMFRNAYGHWITEGPFGTNVKLPDFVKTTDDADGYYWIGQYHGTVCGMTNAQ